MREVIINSDKLVKILEKRTILHAQITEINDQQLTLEDEKQKIAYKMDELKNKTTDVLKKNPIEVTEFEYISQIELQDGKAVAIIEDQVEQYKEAIREGRINKV